MRISRTYDNQLLLINWLLVANLTVACKLPDPFFLVKILDRELTINFVDANESTKRYAKRGTMIRVRRSDVIWNVWEKIFGIYFAKRSVFWTSAGAPRRAYAIGRNAALRSSRYHSRTDARAWWATWCRGVSRTSYYFPKRDYGR